MIPNVMYDNKYLISKHLVMIQLFFLPTAEVQLAPLLHAPPPANGRQDLLCPPPVLPLCRPVRLHAAGKHVYLYILANSGG